MSLVRAGLPSRDAAGSAAACSAHLWRAQGATAPVFDTCPLREEGQILRTAPPAVTIHSGVSGRVQRGWFMSDPHEGREGLSNCILQLGSNSSSLTAGRTCSLPSRAGTAPTILHPAANRRLDSREKAVRNVTHLCAGHVSL